MSALDLRQCFRYSGAAPVLAMHGYEMQAATIMNFARQDAANRRAWKARQRLRDRVAELEGVVEILVEQSDSVSDVVSAALELLAERVQEPPG